MASNYEVIAEDFVGKVEPDDNAKTLAAAQVYATLAIAYELRETRELLAKRLSSI